MVVFKFIVITNVISSPRAAPKIKRIARRCRASRKHPEYINVSEERVFAFFSSGPPPKSARRSDEIDTTTSQGRANHRNSSDSDSWWAIPLAVADLRPSCGRGEDSSWALTTMTAKTPSWLVSRKRAIDRPP